MLISPAEEDHRTLQHLFQQHGWTLHTVGSLGSAIRMLSERRASVVITERDFPIGDWKDVLQVVQGLPHPPLAIVISLQADNYLWAEALNLGAYDVLAKPLDETEAFRVLTSAWIHQQQASSARIKAREALKAEVGEAQRRFLEATRHFRDAVKDVAAGIPSPDSAARLERPEYVRRRAFDEYQEALKKLQENLEG